MNPGELIGPDKYVHVLTDAKHTTLWVFMAGKKYITEGFCGWAERVMYDTLLSWAESAEKQDGKWYSINLN